MKFKKNLEKMEGGENVYRIAICDDDIYTCTSIENLIIKYKQDMGIEIEVDIYYSGEKLCQKLNDKEIYDLIFLDIELLNINGIDVGRFIRNELKDDILNIVYISAKEQYALELFKTQPFDFLIKPLDDKDVLCVLKQILKKIDKGKKYFEFGINKNVYRVKFNEIVYFQSDKRKIILVTINERLEFYGNLTAIYKNLPEEYIRVHKSYIINNNYASEYTYEWVKMLNDEIIMISKPYRKEVRMRLLAQKG